MSDTIKNLNEAIEKIKGISVDCSCGKHPDDGEDKHSVDCNKSLCNDALALLRQVQAEQERKAKDFSCCGELKHAVAVARASADNENYLCAVTIKQAQDAIDTIEQLKAEQEEKDKQIADLQTEIARLKI